MGGSVDRIVGAYLWHLYSFTWIALDSNWRLQQAADRKLVKTAHCRFVLFVVILWSPSTIGSSRHIKPIVPGFLPSRDVHKSYAGMLIMRPSQSVVWLTILFIQILLHIHKSKECMHSLETIKGLKYQNKKHVYICTILPSHTKQWVPVILIASLQCRCYQHITIVYLCSVVQRLYLTFFMHKRQGANVEENVFRFGNTSRW